MQQAAAPAAEEAELQQALERSKITAAAEVPSRTFYTVQERCLGPSQAFTVDGLSGCGGVDMPIDVCMWMCMYVCMDVGIDVCINV